MTIANLTEAVTVITKETLQARIAAQGVDSPKNIATICPACGTVQSYALARKLGASDEQAKGLAAYSCVGRIKGSAEGCNWTLGGVLKIHTLAVMEDDGEVMPFFELATAEQAKELKARVDAMAELEVKP